MPFIVAKLASAVCRTWSQLGQRLRHVLPGDRLAIACNPLHQLLRFHLDPGLILVIRPGPPLPISCSPVDGLAVVILHARQVPQGGLEAAVGRQLSHSCAASMPASQRVPAAAWSSTG